jgi:hypothetical protein
MKRLLILPAIIGVICAGAAWAQYGPPEMVPMQQMAAAEPGVVTPITTGDPGAYQMPAAAGYHARPLAAYNPGAGMAPPNYGPPPMKIGKGKKCAPPMCPPQMLCAPPMCFPPPACGPIILPIAFY